MNKRTLIDTSIAVALSILAAIGAGSIGYFIGYLEDLHRNATIIKQGYIYVREPKQESGTEVIAYPLDSFTIRKIK